MVRFATDPNAGHDEAEVRSFRGAHPVLFEDGDQGSAFRARAPHLSWDDIDGCPALPYVEFADFTLRYMHPRGEDAAFAGRLFHTGMPTAAPLSRCWQLALPALGLAGVGTETLTRRSTRKKVKAALDALPADRREQLGIEAGEWMDRIAPAALTAAPFNTHGDWLQHLTWGLLAPGGDLGAAVDLLYAARDPLSDSAYSAAGATRQMLQAMAQQVRTAISGDLVGEALALEVASTLVAAASPDELVVHTTPVGRAQRVRDLFDMALLVGERAVAAEARLVRRALGFGALDELPALRALAAGLVGGDIERVILEVASSEEVADRTVATVSLLHRVERALRLDTTYLELPSTVALPLADRINGLVERRGTRAMAREVAPGGGGGGGGGGSGTGGAADGTVALSTTSKPYQQALVEELSSMRFDAFWSDARPILVRGDARSVRQALTILLAAEGAPEGGAISTKLGAAARPLGIFHQMLWGKLSTVPLKVELDDLARARQQLAGLLGHAAAETLFAHGEVPEGTPLSILTLNGLESAIRNDGKPLGDKWAEFNLEQLLLKPLNAATRPARAADVALEDAYTDELRLRSLVKPGAAVFALLGSPDDDEDSFAAAIEAAADFLARTIGVTNEIDRRARRAVRNYIIGCTVEWGRAYDDVRFSQDVRLAPPLKFVQKLSHAHVQFRAKVKKVEKLIDEARADYDSDSDAAPSKASGPKDKEPKDRTPKEVQPFTSNKGVLTIKATGARYDFAAAVEKHSHSGECVKYAMLCALNVKPLGATCGARGCRFKHTGRIDGLRTRDFRLDASQRRKTERGATEPDGGAAEDVDGGEAQPAAGGEAQPAAEAATVKRRKGAAPKGERGTGTGAKERKAKRAKVVG